MTPFRLALLLSIAALVGCRENPIVPEPNDRPVAVARVVLPSGPADETTFPGMGPGTGQDALRFDFNGGSLDVQLDGTASSDKDGKIRKYNWQSATLIDGDAGTAQPAGMKDPLWMPEGAPKGWPEDKASPVVTITAPGVYSFNLWVTDEMDSVSEPDTIKFTVGSAVDPAVTACLPTVLPSVPDPCKNCLCGVSDTCRNDVKETACGEACWTFIRCLGEKCPDFRAMAAMMDYSCLTMNCAAEYQAGMMGATQVGACIAMCPEECRSTPAMMP